MRGARSISKSVIACGIGGIGLIVFLTWRGLTRHDNPAPAEATTTSVQLETAPPTGSEELAQAASGTPASSPTELIPIPLRDVLTEAENGPWLKDRTFLSLPRGPQSLGGIASH